METARDLEETLRALAKLLGEPAAEPWRKRVEKYADQVARGNLAETARFLAMYQGGMGSFLDLQGSTERSHQELNALRDRAYRLANEAASVSCRLGT